MFVSVWAQLCLTCLVTRPHHPAAPALYPIGSLAALAVTPNTCHAKPGYRRRSAVLSLVAFTALGSVAAVERHALSAAALSCVGLLAWLLESGLGADAQRSRLRRHRSRNVGETR